MKKAEQKKVNETVMLAVDEINDSIEKNGLTYYERLRTCNARVYRSGEWTILESYNTMVAAVDGVGRCYDFFKVYLWVYKHIGATYIKIFQ